MITWFNLINNIYLIIYKKTFYTARHKTSGARMAEIC